MDKKTLDKLDRILKRLPETWIHVKEPAKGTSKPLFDHVDYKSNAEGKPKVRLVGHISPDLCELLVTLKNNAADLIAIARANPEAGEPVRAKAAKARKKRRITNTNA
jgi:hypothetical protein